MKITIITINYNNIDGLKKTIKSIGNQVDVDKSRLEFIVIDGLSNDGVKEFIEKSKTVDRYLIEKDKGIADAFNKGINLASGEYIYFINSGDTFYDKNSLKNILDNFENNDSDILINKVAMVDEKGVELSLVGKNINLIQQIYRNYLPHQGMIIRKKLFDRYGLYDISYRLGMDYEWSLRLLKDADRLNIVFQDNIICKMLEGGVSQTRYVDTFMAYHKARMKNNVSNVLSSYLISLFFILKRSIGIWLRRLVK